MASFLTDRLEPVSTATVPVKVPHLLPFLRLRWADKTHYLQHRAVLLPLHSPLCHHLLLNLHDNSNRRPLNPLEPALPLLLCVKILCQALLLMSPLLVAILSMAPSLCLSQKQARDHDHPHFLSRRLCRTSLLLPPVRHLTLYAAIHTRYPYLRLMLLIARSPSNCLGRRRPILLEISDLIKCLRQCVSSLHDQDLIQERPQASLPICSKETLYVPAFSARNLIWIMIYQLGIETTCYNCVVWSENNTVCLFWLSIR